MTRKIAIIGAGPAGYTLAQELVKAENEYQIDIFDKEAEIGGAIILVFLNIVCPKHS